MKCMTALVVLLVGVSMVYGKERMVKISADKETTIEAEDFTSRSTRAGHRWEVVRSKRKDVPSHIIAAPANNMVFDINKQDFEKKSPVVEYDVEFEKAATYYVWLKGKGGPGDASVALGIDGAMQKTDFVGFFPSDWVWFSTYNSGPRIQLEAQTPGKHTICFWMVEDGFKLDKFLLTANGDFRPDDKEKKAPDESGKQVDTNSAAH